jgi:preprotein translocase subunit Sec61beta
MPSKRKRRGSGPMTAAGLVAFYEDYEEKFRLSPLAIVMISIIFSLAVILAHALS